MLCDQDRLVGLKLYPGYQNVRMDDPRIFQVLELANTHGLPVTIHGGELHHCCSRRKREMETLACGHTSCWIDELGMLAHPSAFTAAAQAFPDVTFVIAPYFENLRELMRCCPNVVTDLSGQFLSGTHEDTPQYQSEITRELMRFIQEVPDGKRRLMFGSDFPIQSFQSTIDLVESLDVSDQVKSRIYRYNALDVYKKLGGML